MNWSFGERSPTVVSRGARPCAVDRKLRIDVEAAGVKVNSALRRGVERHLAYALSRFGDRVEHVVVHLSNRKNALGDVDRHCRMQAWLGRRGGVEVETMDGRGAIARAAERLAARVEWALVDGRTEMPSPPVSLVPPAPKRQAPSAHARRQRRAAPANQRRKRP
jgi:hypothetical protein